MNKGKKNLIAPHVRGASMCFQKMYVNMGVL